MNPYVDDARIVTVQNLLCARIESLLDALGVSLVRTGKFYVGCCPVHGGDNANALNLFHSGDKVPGYWRCYTGHCEAVFKRTILGFVRGVLSNQRHGWTTHRSRTIQDKQPIVPWRDTVDWACEFLGQKLLDIKVDRKEMERAMFAGTVAHVTRKPQVGTPTLSRESIRKWLKIPGDYFVQRGWSPEVLDRYDVGAYPAPGKPLSNRVAVPIYDDSGKGVLGFTGRSIFEKCGECLRWHSPTDRCPDAADAASAKWVNHGFDRDSVLYNWWFARKTIAETGVACLVEGPGDLWRLEEAGIRCGLALLGADLAERQQVLLEMSGAMTVIVLTNMDEAGRRASEQLRQQLRRLCRVVTPELPAKDLGEMRPAAVRELVLPLTEKYRKTF